MSLHAAQWATQPTHDLNLRVEQLIGVVLPYNGNELVFFSVYNNILVDCLLQYGT